MPRRKRRPAPPDHWTDPLSRILNIPNAICAPLSPLQRACKIGHLAHLAQHLPEEKAKLDAKIRMQALQERHIQEPVIRQIPTWAEKHAANLMIDGDFGRLPEPQTNDALVPYEIGQSNCD